MKRLFKSLLIVVALMLILCSCNNDTFTTSSAGENNPASYETQFDLTEKTNKNDNKKDDNKKNDLTEDKKDSFEKTEKITKKNNGKNSASTNNNLVKFTMENGGSFIIELYPQFAPETVKNFKELVITGFYDGLTFHRVMEGFMAQGGDPEGTGFGGSDKTITGEFALNGFASNTLSHTRGVVSMARSQDYDSASSQFFICYDDASFLDGQYAAFGKVIEGMEVVDAFLEVERRYSGGELSSPVEPIVIESAVIVE